MPLISKKNLALLRAALVGATALAATSALAQQPAAPAAPTPTAAPPAPTATPAVRADRIERVVVFGDRAQVTRKVQAECVGGEAKVPFGPLPASAVERTLRGAAEGGATAVGLTARKVEFNPVDDARLAPIRAQLDVFDEQLRDNDRKVATEQAARSDGEHYGEFLNTLVMREARGAKPAVATWGRSLEVLRTERAGHDSTLVALNRQRSIIERERSVVQHQYDALLGGNSDTEAWQVEVAVDCGGKTRVPVTLSYVVPGATWQPEYDLRFVANQGAVGPGKVTLGVGAAVQQATGEDWTDVTLVLSTAKPWLGVEAPVPAPMRIGGSKGSDKKVLVQATERRKVLTRNGPAQQTAQGPGAASLDDKGQSVTLTLPHKVDIRSDGRPYWAPVDRLNTAGQASFVAVPKKSAAVYRLVRFDNPGAYPLLAGRLHTWRDDAFVGTQRVEHTGPGAPVEVSLGTDETLRVVREVVEDRTREPGFLSSTRTLPRAYAMKVRSSGGRPVVVELRDQLPVSKSDDVKVSIDTERTTPGFQHDKLTGRLTWPVTVPASGEGEVKLGYRIKLPDDWKL
jgi:uncharacterized protein (TIGR02231 family)